MENFPIYTPEAVDDDDDDESEESAAEKKDGKKEEKRSLFERVKDDGKDKQEEKEDSKEKAELETPETLELPEQDQESLNTDGEVPLESLADEELKMVAQKYIEVRGDELKQELADAPKNTPEEAEILANEALLEKFKNKLAAKEGPTKEALDQGEAETADELGLELPESPEEEPVDNNAEPETDAAEAPEDADSEADPNAAQTAGSSSSSTATPTSPNPTVVGGPGPAANAGTGSNPPAPPPVQNRNWYGGGLPPVQNFNTPSPNAQPTPNSAPSQPPEVIVRRSAALPYLVVGYLLGRRRGRIKTEKKLLPIQKKLEKEVTQLQEDIVRREEKIRGLVREKLSARPAVAESLANGLKASKERKAKPAAADEKMIGAFQRPEKIGKLAVTYEKPEAAAVLKTPEAIKIPERPKPVEAMTVAELLLVAGRIPIEQSTVKRLFETHRLNEEGLRRVTRAYLRGEHYERILHDNQLEPEKLQTAGHSETWQPAAPLGNSTAQTVSPIRSSQASPAVSAGHSTAAQLNGSNRNAPDTQPSKPKSGTSKTVIISIVVILTIVLLLFMLR